MFLLHAVSTRNSTYVASHVNISIISSAENRTEDVYLGRRAESQPSSNPADLYSGLWMYI